MASAIQAEIDSLLKMSCFEFHDPGYKPSRDFQPTSLSMIFEVNHCGRRKAPLVAGGHLVALHNLSAKSTVVKGVSVAFLISLHIEIIYLCHVLTLAMPLSPLLGWKKFFLSLVQNVYSKRDLLSLLKRLYMALKALVEHSACILLTFYAAMVLVSHSTTVMFG